MSHHAPPHSYGAPGPDAGTNQKAVWSLVVSILGIVFCGILSFVGIFLARSARTEIARTRQRGEGMATAGLVLGLIGIVLLILNVVLIATDNFYYDF